MEEKMEVRYDRKIKRENERENLIWSKRM